MALTTLIVDDHALFRSTARMLLESEGYVVVGEAADGAEAVSADQLTSGTSTIWSARTQELVSTAASPAMVGAGVEPREGASQHSRHTVGS
jgi:DNA-binding NarL/FixJ family response regulator